MVAFIFIQPRYQIFLKENLNIDEKKLGVYKNFFKAISIVKL